MPLCLREAEMLARLKGARRWVLRGTDYHVGATIRWRALAAAVAPLLAGPKNVLDAGSGNGVHAFRLAQRYPHSTFHGVELDAAHVSSCQARSASEPLPNLTFEQGDLTRPLGHAIYDLAYSIDVLEHIEDDRRVLAHLTEALRPGGRLLLHTPLTPQRHWLRRFDLERATRDDHVREGYGEAELLSKVREAGLEPLSLRYTHGRWGTLAWELWQLARWRIVAKLLLWPLAMVLVRVDGMGRLAWGNCVLLEARRPDGDGNA